VKLDGKDIYLDPGTKYCPYGVLRWMRTSTAALRPDKKTPTFVTIPVAQQDKAVTRRTVKATVETDGSLKADLEVKFEGSEALERRLSADQTDDAGKKKQLEDEVKSWLSATATVKLIEAQGWDGSDGPLTAHFNIEIPDYATPAGKRLMMPSYLFQVKGKDAFAHADRKYPVYFPYAFSQFDSVSIEFPAGQSMEGSPQTQNAKLPYAAYQNIAKVEGNRIMTQRTLLLNGIYFPTNIYSEVKGFFNKVQAGDEQQAVLRAGGTTSAQKAH